jgi:hypothetical protein
VPEVAPGTGPCQHAPAAFWPHGTAGRKRGVPGEGETALTQFTIGSSACGEHEACRLAALKRKSGEESQSGLGAIGATIDRGASSGKYAALPGFEPMTQEQT